MSAMPSRCAALLLALLGIASCSSKSERAVAPPASRGDAARPATIDASTPVCTKATFAESIPVEEASGATVVGDYLLVVGDSGTRGEYNEIDAATGAVLATGRLPLDAAASDDLEGLTRIGDTLYAITSSGFLRHWKRKPSGGYELTEPAYPIGPSDGDRPLSCSDPHKVNCGRNYEGLCVYADVPAGHCAGYAVSKKDGLLYCLVVTDAGRLRADPSRTIEVAGTGVITGCDVSPNGNLLWVGSNIFGRNAVYLIRNWSEPRHAKVTLVDHIGPGFGEAIAAGPGGAIYRFSDLGGSPSFVERYICQ